VLLPNEQLLTRELPSLLADVTVRHCWPTLLSVTAGRCCTVYAGRCCTRLCWSVLSVPFMLVGVIGPVHAGRCVPVLCWSVCTRPMLVGVDSSHAGRCWQFSRWSV